MPTESTVGATTMNHNTLPKYVLTLQEKIEALPELE